MKWMIAHKYVLMINAISVMVAFLTHFPELIALFDFEAERTLFPGMRGRDVAVEMAFTYLSLLLLFFLSERLFRFGDSRVNFGWKKVLASFLLTWLMSNLLGKAFVFMHDMLGVPAIDATLHKYLHPLRDFL